MSDRPTTQTTARRCEVQGCVDEWAIQCDGERRCYAHALQRGNEIRAARGLPPITIDDEGGGMHVVQ